MLIHREALELARNAAPAGDGAEFTMTCVQIGQDGAVTVTDGHHWLRMAAAAGEPNLFDEIAEQETGALDGPVMVPADVVQAFNAAMKKRKATKGLPVPHVVVAQQEDRVTLRSSDGKTTRTFLLEAIDPALRYPDVDRTIFSHAPTRRIVLSVDLLATIVRTLKSCKAASLTLGLPDDPFAPIHLSAHTETGPLSGAVMPMRDGAAPIVETSEQSSLVVDGTHVSLVDTATGEVLFDGSVIDAAAAQAADQDTVRKPMRRHTDPTHAAKAKQKSGRARA